jgi:hypothetical protein
MKYLHKYLTITLALAALVLHPAGLPAAACTAPDWVNHHPGTGCPGAAPCRPAGRGMHGTGLG